MRLIKSLENHRLGIARSDLDEGTPDDVVVRAEAYLALLEEHLENLRSLKGVPRVEFAEQSRFARLLIEQVRSAIRTEIEESTSERNRIADLLESLTMVTGWASVQTLNEQAFRNACDWELIGTAVRSITAGATMSLPEAAAEVGRLHREKFFADRNAA